MFLLFTVMGIIGIILFIILAAKKKMKIIPSTFGLFISIAILGFGVYLGNQPEIDMHKFDYIENVGWRTNGKTPMTETEYKLSCTNALTYEQYKSNPLLYKEVIYKLENVLLWEITTIEDDDDVFIIVWDKYGYSWTCRCTKSSIADYEEGDFVSVYGEFTNIDIENNILYMRCRYIEK